jgi:hypothetical protein
MGQGSFSGLIDFDQIFSKIRCQSLAFTCTEGEAMHIRRNVSHLIGRVLANLPAYSCRVTGKGRGLNCHSGTVNCWPRCYGSCVTDVLRRRTSFSKFKLHSDLIEYIHLCPLPPLLPLPLLLLLCPPSLPRPLLLPFGPPPPSNLGTRSCCPNAPSANRT